MNELKILCPFDKKICVGYNKETDSICAMYNQTEMMCSLMYIAEDITEIINSIKK